MTELYKLCEYTTPDFLIDHIDLTIDLTKKPVHSQAKLYIHANPQKNLKSTNLVLNGENMQLTSIVLNGTALTPTDYINTDQELIIKNLSQTQQHILETSSLLGENTDLFGLYETEGVVLVKAETEGLRRVLYCIDRPDNLATYTTTIIANKKTYPTLLSNGELLAQSDLDNGAHSVTWHDSIPKPSYLFALIAGNLQHSVTHYKTLSGRVIPIEFYVPLTATTQCEFAKEVLVKAMRWDEENFHSEYYLKHHMVAGVDKYATGASEPAGLNLFNTEFLYATPKTKTDYGILYVAEVVAHEYAHSLTGNSTTISNWFNLAWKEGLTTLRAALFREDLFGSDLIRLLDGKNLDDRAPRPDTYTAVRSLYTAAAYEKSADVFRMIMLMMGKKKFYAYLSQFLKANYLKHVTIEQTLNALTEYSGTNVRPFLDWFTQTGIPKLQIADEFNSKTHEYTLKITVLNRNNRPIPFVFGLLNAKGEEILSDTLVLLDKDQIEFTFKSIGSVDISVPDVPRLDRGIQLDLILNNKAVLHSKSLDPAVKPRDVDLEKMKCKQTLVTKPIPSLLRSFSAPVYINYAYSINELLVLMLHDTNLYNRCEAAKLLINLLVRDFCTGTKIELSHQFYATYRALLNDSSLNQWMLAELLTLPSEEELIANNPKADYELIAKARKTIVSALANDLKTDLSTLHKSLKTQADISKPLFTIFDIADAGKRRLDFVCCSYLINIEPKLITALLVEQFTSSLKNNMTITTNALTLLAEINCPEADAALELFYEYWKHDTNTINYWFKIQAGVHSDKVVSRVKNLMLNPVFDITSPNKVMALLGTFIKNPYGFHSWTGDGYKLITDAILQLDRINPALAGRLTAAFANREQFDPKRLKYMLDSVLDIKANAVSVDVLNAVGPC